MLSAGETVTFLTAGSILDPYSGQSTGESWADEDVTSHEVSGVLVGHGGSSEPLQDARNSVESDYDLFCPPGTEADRKQKVVVRGEVCNVVGRPFSWKWPSKDEHAGVVVQVERTDG